MKSEQVYKVGKILKLFSPRRAISSSSTTSQPQLSKPPIHNTFFKSGAKDELVKRLCRDNNFKEAIDILCEQKRLREAIQILDHVDRPSAATYSTLLQLCLQLRALDEGMKVHAHTKTSGFVPGVVISNRILDMLFDEMAERDLCSWNIMISGYAKAGRLQEARKLFDQMTERDNFSWTAMISGYVRHDLHEEALELFRAMQRHENFKCNKFTMSSALAASAAIQSLHLGKEIHGHILRIGLDLDGVGSSTHFDKTVDRDVVSWTAMIDRYFKEDHAAEELGKQVHGYMTRIGFDPSSFAASTLVHMYTKCGNIKNARRVFNGMPRPDLNGQPDEALQFFELLLKSGTQPDHITFVGVLSACTHAGLVDKGLEYFDSIKEKHGLTHTADHYACLIDLLSRSGRLQEAEDIIDKMPMKPDKFLWASLLGGCRIHGNLKLAKRAAEALFEIEPENPATYTTLANIYATAGLWGGVAEVRKVMDARGVVKKPGLSWIEIKREVHVFLVGDTSHAKSKEIHEFLGKLSKRMKEEGYVPDTNFVLHDVEEEQKEQNLSYHSEKLAVAFGIISTPAGTLIKVFKNLRTCVDCHTAIKFISKIAKRKIIVRDSNRFHCFEDGSCSSEDTWQRGHFLVVIRGEREQSLSSRRKDTGSRGALEIWLVEEAEDGCKLSELHWRGVSQSKVQVIDLVFVAAGMGGGTDSSGASPFNDGYPVQTHQKVVDVPPVIEWIQSLEALLLFPLELLIMGEWKSTKHELQLLISAILTQYVLITVLFALPSFLILYFAYPCLNCANGPAFGCILMKDFLKSLSKRLKCNTTAYENYHRDYVPEGQSPKSDPKEPLRVYVLFQHIQKMLSSETAVIAETGDSWFNCQKLKLPRGCRYEFQMQYRSIGWLVGVTLGYAQAVPNKRVMIACIGDGSFYVTLLDISTMILYEQGKAYLEEYVNPCADLSRKSLWGIALPLGGSADKLEGEGAGYTTTWKIIRLPHELRVEPRTFCSGPVTSSNSCMLLPGYYGYLILPAILKFGFSRMIDMLRCWLVYL
ncbi:hypothetical protein AAG906_020501 [Vitis piasezkii]